MPIYLDHHRKFFGATPEVYADTHKRDLEVQAKHGVKYLSFYVDEKQEHMFCLVEAPSKQAIADMHRESHGLVPMEIFEVEDRN